MIGRKRGGALAWTALIAMTDAESCQHLYVVKRGLVYGCVQSALQTQNSTSGTRWVIITMYYAVDGLA